MRVLLFPAIGLLVVVLFGVIHGYNLEIFPLEGCSTDDMDILLPYIESGSQFMYAFQEDECAQFVQFMLSYPFNEMTSRFVSTESYEKFSALAALVNISSQQIQSSYQSLMCGYSERKCCDTQGVVDRRVALSQGVVAEKGRGVENGTSGPKNDSVKEDAIIRSKKVRVKKDATKRSDKDRSKEEVTKSFDKDRAKEEATKSSDKDRAKKGAATKRSDKDRAKKGAATKRSDKDRAKEDATKRSGKSRERKHKTSHFENYGDRLPSSYGKDREDMSSSYGRDREDMSPNYGRDREGMPPRYGRDREDMSPHYGRDREDMPPHYGRNREDMSPHYGRDWEDMSPQNGRDREDISPHYGRDKFRMDLPPRYRNDPFHDDTTPPFNKRRPREHMNQRSEKERFRETQRHN